MMSRRSGITSTEVVCAAIVVGVVSATVAPALVYVAKQNRTSSQHLNASAGLGNILDEITATPFSDVTSDSVANVKTPDWLASQLTDSKLVLTVDENNEGKRVSAKLSWESVHGGLRETVTLHAWMFKTGDST